MKSYFDFYCIIGRIIEHELISKELLCSIEPYPADHDYCRFLSVLLVDQITVIGNDMCV